MALKLMRDFESAVSIDRVRVLVVLSSFGVDLHWIQISLMYVYKDGYIMEIVVT